MFRMVRLPRSSFIPAWTSKSNYEWTLDSLSGSDTVGYATKTYGSQYGIIRIGQRTRGRLKKQTLERIQVFVPQKLRNEIIRTGSILIKFVFPTRRNGSLRQIQSKSCNEKGTSKSKGLIQKVYYFSILSVYHIVHSQYVLTSKASTVPFQTKKRIFGTRNARAQSILSNFAQGKRLCRTVNRKRLDSGEQLHQGNSDPNVRKRRK